MNNKLLNLIKSIEDNYGLRVYISILNKDVRLLKNIYGIEVQIGYIKVTQLDYPGYFIEITKEYRGKGLGTLLFNLYKRISEDNTNFDFLEDLYSHNISIISFLLKNGYIIEGVIYDEKYFLLSNVEKNTKLKYIELEKDKMKGNNRLKDGGKIIKLNGLYKLVYKKKKSNFN